MKQPSLRSLAAGIALTIWLAACTPFGSSSPTAPAASGDLEGNLTVLEWSGFEEPDMWVDFADAHPDIPVDFLFAVSDEDFFAQTKAVSGADIVHIYTPFNKFYVDEGLIQEIDISRIEHWDEIPVKFQQMCTFEGKVYCVPWDWGLTSLIYRTDKITDPEESWAMLFDEANQGHIGMWDSGFGAYEVGSYVLGYDQSNLTDEQFEDIRQLWIDHKKLDPFYWLAESESITAMTEGDVWVSYGWNGGYRALLDAGVPVAFAEPKEGRSTYVGLYAITAESDNVDAALEFLDLKLAEKTATNLLTQFAYGHVNPQYYSVVTDQALIETLSLDDPTALDRTNFSKTFDYLTFQKFIDVWAEVRDAQ